MNWEYCPDGRGSNTQITATDAATVWFASIPFLARPPDHLTPVKKRGGATAGRIPNWRPKSALLDLVPNQFACLFKGCEINVAIHETLEMCLANSKTNPGTPTLRASNPVRR